MMPIDQKLRQRLQILLEFQDLLKAISFDLNNEKNKQWLI